MFDPAINPQALRNWRHCLAFGLGSGLAKVAPGTVGTLVAVPFYLLLSQLPTWLYASCVIGAFAFGIWLCNSVSSDLAVNDHSGIVWDEFVGYWLTMFMVPVGWGWIVAGFVLFRLLDAWKPWPIRWFDANVHGGFGIMLDDALAAAPACAVLHVIRIFLGA